MKDYEFEIWHTAENFVHAENRRLGRILDGQALTDEIVREAGLLKRSLKILSEAGYDLVKVGAVRSPSD